MKFATSLALVAALVTDVNAACSATVPEMTDFDGTQFAGLWNIQSSTYFANDAVGCIKFQSSEPNSRDQKLDIALRSVSLFSSVPTRGGNISVEAFQLDHATTGKLTYDQVGGLLEQTKYTVMETDYTNYAILHECTSNSFRVLNYKSDDVHILTRSESVDSATLDGYKTSAEALITGSESRFEDIEQTACLPQDWNVKMRELFSNPDNFWRKW